MTYQLLTFIGTDVYSPFRLQKINQELQDQSSQQALLQAKHFYVVEVEHTLDEAAIKQIEQLLSAQRTDADVAANEVLVMPRVGTISPWSSKATDIFHHCGLSTVSRVEAGRLMTVSARSAKVDQQMHDRMTEGLYEQVADLPALFDHHAPKAVQQIDLPTAGKGALEELNQSLGLALSAEEIDYLYDSYMAANQLPTDVELMMFAQANSEHCRHKIFNADWHIDGEQQTHSLFKMIKNTEAQTSAPATSAYKDNAAVFAGGSGLRMTTDAKHRYQTEAQDIDVLIKVETHNHPTGIEPFAGAATGSGGEIRDEAATGQGAKPKAGLCGFSVSHLKIPGFIQPWEQTAPETPERMATAFDIMQKGPIGAAAFNNEFGRPNICGYFRNFTVAGASENTWRGYYKPIKFAG